jgi:hypothetical protein
MKKTIYAILCAAVGLLEGEAFGYLMTVNQPLNRAIYAGHDSKLIVAGQIVGKDVKPHPPVAEDYPADISLRFRVTTVILGQQSYKDQTLVIPATSFKWPTELLACQEGVRCALVLRTNKWGNKPHTYNIDAVVPVSNTALRTAKDGEESKGILEKEILAELTDEKRPERQEALLLQVAPILTKENAPIVVPFLTSKDIWVVRSALVAAIYATEDKEYIRKATEDVQSFFTTTRPTDLIKDKYVAYPYFFDHYFFLDTRRSPWDDDEANRNLRILNAMFVTGILSDEVKKILKPEPPVGGDGKPAPQP